MKTRIIILAAFALTFLFKPVMAQTTPETFTGATPKLAHYDALYTLNSADDNKIKSVLRSINNAMADPRLKGKLQVELIAFSDGVAVYMKSGPYEKQLKELQEKGVILAQCNNTIVMRNISKTDLFPFISYVPSGNGEIILRQYDGWAIVNL